VGPFVFFDHFGPTTIPPGANADVRPHPHIGLATVSYLFDGEMIHRDSIGSVATLRAGDLNWMNAGRGIVHSERFPKEGERRAHGLQLWVALPRAHEESEPTFQHVDASALPAIEIERARLTLIAGTAYGRTSPVRTLSSLFYLEARVPAGASLALPDEHEERAVYVVSGAIEIGATLVSAAHMAVLAAGETAAVRASEDAHVMLLGGAPLDGERHLLWNFVSSSRERLERAKSDWRERRFPSIPGDDQG
jgi:redox-sensitive bicupin YhaK (pirin superfamily)